MSAFALRLPRPRLGPLLLILATLATLPTLDGCGGGGQGDDPAGAARPGVPAAASASPTGRSGQDPNAAQTAQETAPGPGTQTPAAGGAGGGAASNVAGGSVAGGTGAGGTGTGGPGATAEILLYFADQAGTLQPEKRQVPWDGPVTEQARRVVQALLDGPAGGTRGLTAVIPADAALRAVYAIDDGTVYVDLDAAFARGLSDGSEDALLAVWSITDSLAANIPDVRQVKILVEGEEVRDLGGHLDLTRPLVPGMAMR